MWCVLSHLLMPMGCGMDHDMNHASGSEQSDTHPESAIEILKKRYARGEINKQEFEERKKDLV
ncbi:MAG: SHOCT domain-containing protein [Dehalococcoidales bacterium]|nr:SHOCT domain-containing protein [Dehalococcoidales bacterium]